MGLFSKRHVEPLVHPRVGRTVHVPAGRDDVVAHLRSYSGLWSPRRVRQHDLLIGVDGGWTAIRLPLAVHPWQLHNLAYWMLDCPQHDGAGGGVIAVSETSPDHPAYRLVQDPEGGDALCGWDDDGNGWTVRVPDNRIVRGEDVPVARHLFVPSGHSDWRQVPVLFEDPGHGMNERNESNGSSRSQMRERNAFVI